MASLLLRQTPKAHIQTLVRFIIGRGSRQAAEVVPWGQEDLSRSEGSQLHGSDFDARPNGMQYGPLE